MFTKKERYLERFFDSQITIPLLSGEKWYNYFNNKADKVIREYELDLLPSDVKNISESLEPFIQYISELLNTPRLIKSFIKHFEYKISGISSDVRLKELVCLSVIHASNIKLFEWIQNNRILLIDPGSASDEMWAVQQLIHSSEDSNDKDTIIEKELKKIRASSIEIEFIKKIFGNEVKSIDENLEYANYEKSICNSHMFACYFFRKSLPILYTNSGQIQFIEFLKSNRGKIDEIYEYTEQEYLNCENQADKDLIASKLREFITTLEPANAKDVCIILGILAKKYVSESIFQAGKRFFAYSTFSFLNREDVDNNMAISFLNELFRNPVSHDFYAVLAFYFFRADEKRKEKQIRKNYDPSFTQELKKLFVYKCKDVFYTNETPNDLFDENVSDSPMQMIYRWNDLTDDNKHQDYIISFIEVNKDNLSKLIDKVRSEEQSSLELLLPLNVWTKYLGKYKLYNNLTDHHVDFLRRVSQGQYSKW
ncbi:MAG: hypothetical protein OCC49_19555 [Fibrobacterales bacterium]